MAGRGTPPKAQTARRRRNKPARGEWQATEGFGWQHGPVPDPPDGLKEESLKAWTTWMRSWFAAHWTADDLPGLRVIILLYDQVERGEYVRANELRLQMDTYGITPKGQQDRRWAMPEAPAEEPPAPKSTKGPYGHLQSVG